MSQDEETEEGTPEMDARRWQIANRRFREETAGTIINGVRYATDRESQALVTGAVLAAQRAQANGEAFSIQWKSPNGWQTVDAATMVAVGDAVRSHVQACFDRESTLLSEVEKSKYTDDMLGTGWPQ